MRDFKVGLVGGLPKRNHIRVSLINERELAVNHRWKLLVARQSQT